MSLIIQGNVDDSGRVAVQQLLNDGICQSVVYRSETASTNSDAITDLREAAISTDQLPRLYLADLQTSGRGRHGRTWLSPADSLTFSVCLSFRLVETTLLSIAVGVAIARALEYDFAPLHTRLKWPNDVYLNHRKVAGILLETIPQATDRVVVGIGININQAPDLPPTGNAIEPTSIASTVGRPVARYMVLETIARSLAEVMRELDENQSSVVDAFRQRCVLTGKQVQFQSNMVQTGVCAGISDTGLLQIDTNECRQLCQTGEVKLLRIQP